MRRTVRVLTLISAATAFGGTLYSVDLLSIGNVMLFVTDVSVMSAFIQYPTAV